MHEDSQPPYPSQGFQGTSATSSISAMDVTPGTPPSESRARSTMSPQSGAGGAYGPSSGRGSNYSFEVSPLPPHQSSMESSPDPPTYEPVDTSMIPRTAPMPIFVPTRGLPVPTAIHGSLDNPPDLMPPNEYSPWTSPSDLESTFSTPNDRPSQRRQMQQISQDSLVWPANSNFLASFPTAARQEISTSGGLATMATTQYFVSNGFSVSPHVAPVSHNAYNPLLDGAILSDYADEQGQSLLDPLIGGHHAMSHQRSSSVRSQTPEISIATSGQTADTLVTPAPLSSRMNPMLQGRQKTYVLEGGNQDGQLGMHSTGGTSYWKANIPEGPGIFTGTGLKTGCANGGMTMVTPLPRSVRNAIPSYIDIYWERFHPFYPIIHRQVFEQQGEDVLRCAMAAIATQFSNGQEDRIRGAQLHDYAWQEAKRVSHNASTQTINDGPF